MCRKFSVTFLSIFLAILLTGFLLLDNMDMSYTLEEAQLTDLPETVAWNMVAQEKPDELEEISISTQATFENVLTVDSYDKDYQLYLYTYEYNGLLYHFYFTGAGESEFIMYMMEKA